MTFMTIILMYYYKKVDCIFCSLMIKTYSFLVGYHLWKRPWVTLYIFAVYYFLLRFEYTFLSVSWRRLYDFFFIFIPNIIFFLSDMLQFPITDFLLFISLLTPHQLANLCYFRLARKYIYFLASLINNETRSVIPQTYFMIFFSWPDMK